jgi:multicomponent Na+:H+ antiporter subunit G
MSEVIGYMLIFLGVFFDVAGCIGLVRFPDVYNRLQASTKCVTLGTILLLFGVALMCGSGAMARALYLLPRPRPPTLSPRALMHRA